MNNKELELKVTIKVKNGTADGAANSLARTIEGKHGGVRLVTTTGDGSGLTMQGAGIEVTAIERADGQAIGLLYEFESYWRESHGEGDYEVEGAMWSDAKVQAWGAFQAAYDIYGRAR